MSTKQTIAFPCICEKDHHFEEAFEVKGPGSSQVQVRCPHPKCPQKDKWLSYTIPFELATDEIPLKGGVKIHPPNQS